MLWSPLSWRDRKGWHGAASQLQGRQFNPELGYCLCRVSAWTSSKLALSVIVCVYAALWWIGFALIGHISVSWSVSWSRLQIHIMLIQLLAKTCSVVFHFHNNEVKLLVISCPWFLIRNDCLERYVWIKGVYCINNYQFLQNTGYSRGKVLNYWSCLCFLTSIRAGDNFCNTFVPLRCCYSISTLMLDQLSEYKVTFRSEKLACSITSPTWPWYYFGAVNCYECPTRTMNQQTQAMWEYKKNTRKQFAKEELRQVINTRGVVSTYFTCRKHSTGYSES